MEYIFVKSPHETSIKIISKSSFLSYRFSYILESKKYSINIICGECSVYLMILENIIIDERSTQHQKLLSKIARESSIKHFYSFAFQYFQILIYYY